MTRYRLDGVEVSGLRERLACPELHEAAWTADASPRDQLAWPTRRGLCLEPAAGGATGQHAEQVVYEAPEMVIPVARKQGGLKDPLLITIARCCASRPPFATLSLLSGAPPPRRAAQQVLAMTSTRACGAVQYARFAVVQTPTSLIHRGSRIRNR